MVPLTRETGHSRYRCMRARPLTPTPDAMTPSRPLPIHRGPCLSPTSPLSAKIAWEIEVRMCASDGRVWPLHVAWHLLTAAALYYGVLADTANRIDCGLSPAGSPATPCPLSWMAVPFGEVRVLASGKDVEREGSAAAKESPAAAGRAPRRSPSPLLRACSHLVERRKQARRFVFTVMDSAPLARAGPRGARVRKTRVAEIAKVYTKRQVDNHKSTE